MPRFVLTLTRIVTVLLLIAGPVAFACHQQAQTRNFRVVRAGVLYRSGQMTLDGLKRVIHDYGIRTVVNLREGVTRADVAEETYCVAEEINFLRIPPRNWAEVDGVVPVEEGVRKFKGVMSDPRNYPVLVHCMAGIHRTGAYCAIYRMEFERWSNDRALAEMRACGYSNLDDEWDILGYLEQYRPAWATHAAHEGHDE
jgi:protein tyrosine/serine phosphatase